MRVVISRQQEASMRSVLEVMAARNFVGSERQSHINTVSSHLTGHTISRLHNMSHN